MSDFVDQGTQEHLYSRDGEQLLQALPSVEFLYKFSEKWLHWALAGSVGLNILLLFLQNQVTVLIGLGTVTLTLSIALLFLVIIGGELWAPRVPQDVWREARHDRLFRAQADELDQIFRIFARKGASTDEMDKAMAHAVEEVVNVYRSRFMVQFSRRCLRRFFVLCCMILVFAGTSRVLVLLDPSAYGRGLTSTSGFINYAYFNFTTFTGYGDIVPISVWARTLAIGTGLFTLVYVILIVNYLFIHEAKREVLLIEYMKARYLGLPV